MLEAYLVILIRKRVTSLTFYSEWAAAICPIDTNLGAAAPLVREGHRPLLLVHEGVEQRNDTLNVLGIRPLLDEFRFGFGFGSP